MAREFILDKAFVTCMGEVEVELSKEGGKTLGCSLASVKNALAGVKIENFSFE